MDRCDWTKERVAELTQLWATGQSASIIGKQMGVTRNAVIGKAYRLSLPSRQTSLTVEQIEDRARKRREAKALSSRRYFARNSGLIMLRRRLLRSPEPELAAPDTTPIPLMQLTEETCRWPHGEGPYLFCGAPVQQDCSYCAFHSQIAYTVEPKEPRSRKRLPPRLSRAA